MKRALEHAVEPGFVAMHEAELRLAGEAGESGGDAGGLVTHRGARLAGNRGVHDAGSDGPGAALAPKGGGHLLNDAQFDAIGGAEAGEILGNGGVKALTGFVLKTTHLARRP